MPVRWHHWRALLSHHTPANAKCSELTVKCRKPVCVTVLFKEKKRQHCAVSNIITVLFRLYSHCASHVTRYGLTSFQGNSCRREDTIVPKLWVCFCAQRCCWCWCHRRSCWHGHLFYWTAYTPCFFCVGKAKSLWIQSRLLTPSAKTQSFFFHFKTNKTKS